MDDVDRQRMVADAILFERAARQWVIYHADDAFTVHIPAALKSQAGWLRQEAEASEWS